MAGLYTGSPLGLVPNFLGSSEGSGLKSPYNESSVKTGSIFSSKHTIIKRNSSSGFGQDPLSFGEPSVIHKDDIYNITTTNILKVLDGYPSMKLKSSDFVYTKDYGVYPNNRLVVCRRFPIATRDDLTRVDTEPNTTLISWFDEEENPISFDFGEEWQDSTDTLKDVLNSLGKDFTIGLVNQSAILGSIASRLGDVSPLPGFTEVLQREILTKLGIIGENSSKLPAGDPNLIMQSSRRRLVSMESPGSGLKGRINVKVKCTWEQKFINGVDPTFIYYDILRTVLSFGGSNATFYLGGSKMASGVSDFLDKLEKDPYELIKKFIDSLKEGLKKVLDNISNFISPKGGQIEDDKLGLTGQNESEIQSEIKRLNKLGEDVIRNITSFITLKYKIPIMGIMNYLTGSPSGPWHVTIGNPMRPILSSGDMICDEVNVTLGKTLAFNDLPSSIECSFTLRSARNLGIGEIFGKLSAGQVRVTIPNPNYGKSWSYGTDEPENLEAMSSFDANSFHNSDQIYSREAELDVVENQLLLQQTEGPNSQIESTDSEISPLEGEGETRVSEVGSSGGNIINRDPNGSQNTTEDPPQVDGRNNLNLNGIDYNYEIERFPFGNRIIVKNQSGSSIYSGIPSLLSDDELLQEARQNLA